MDGEKVWTGKLFGEIGVLTDDGERVQCHICGKFYGNLGGHVSQVHGLGPSEYKRSFELNETTGLLGPELRNVRQKQALARTDTPAYKRFKAAGERARQTVDPDRRTTRGRRLRLQQRLDPKVQAARRKGLERANAVLKERRAAGTHTPAGWGERDPNAMSQLGHQRLRELRRDPNWNQEFAQRVSEGRGGRMIITCVVCDTQFTEPQSHRQRQTCGPACFATLRRQLVDARREAASSEQERRRQHGMMLGERRLAGGVSITEVAEASGLSPAHVSRVERGLNVASDKALARLETALDQKLGPAQDAGAAGGAQDR